MNRPVLSYRAVRLRANLVGRRVLAQRGAKRSCRADVNAATRGAVTLVTPTTSEETRRQGKSETITACAAGTLSRAGPAVALRDRARMRAQKTSVDRFQRKADTWEARRAGALILAGEGRGTPQRYTATPRRRLVIYALRSIASQRDTVLLAQQGRPRAPSNRWLS
jgi:hypothetical protein